MRKFEYQESPSKDELLINNDPFVQYIIVRQKSIASIDASIVKQLMSDTVRAVLNAEIDLADKEEYRLAFDSWWSAASRKVVLKAKDKIWNELSNNPGTVTVGDVIVTAPVRRSQREAFFYKLAKLQVLNQDFDFSESFIEDKNEDSEECNDDLLFYFIDMSLGKTLAQIAHAVLKFAVEHQIEFTELLSKNYSFVALTIDQMNEYSEALSLNTSNAIFSDIHDAGLTELVPGTKTVILISNTKINSD